MTSTNFIPSYRIAARQRRVRLKWWVTVIAASLVLELAGIVCGYGLWCSGQIVLANEQAKTAATIQSADRAIRMLQSELAAQEATLKASQAIRSQPDWSVLLALLAGNLGDGAVLKRCELKPLRAGAAGPVTAAASAAPAAAEAYSLKITGYGQTVADVLQFAQGLENAALFDQIRLVKTDPEPLLAGTAIAFELECSLGAKPETGK
ncbi:MAG: hypothetical protein FJ288_09195 [Planctomycetes bacterium]|nr:hypothetical protein [Planctomycetota bacterium]